MGFSNEDKRYSRLEDRFIKLQLDEEQIKDILARRADDLAQVSEPDRQEGMSTQYVSFKIGTEQFGIEVGFVHEIQPLRNLTLIPCTPDFVVGAVNIRGLIIPVIDIRVFFNMPKKSISDSNKVIVSQVGDKRLGIIADSVEDVTNLTDDDIDSQLATLSGTHEELIRGVSNSQVIVLNIEALVSDKRLVIHENV